MHLICVCIILKNNISFRSFGWIWICKKCSWWFFFSLLWFRFFKKTTQVPWLLLWLLRRFHERIQIASERIFCVVDQIGDKIQFWLGLTSDSSCRQSIVFVVLRRLGQTYSRRSSWMEMVMLEKTKKCIVCFIMLF